MIHPAAHEIKRISQRAKTADSAIAGNEPNRLRAPGSALRWRARASGRNRDVRARQVLNQTVPMEGSFPPTDTADTKGPQERLTR